MSRAIGLMIVVMLVVSLGGCQQPTRTNLTVSLDQTFLDAYGKDRAIEVDVVALRSPESGVLEKDSMTAYWGNKVPKRPNTQVLTLDSKTPEKTISTTDAAWDTWLKDAKCDNAPQVFVLVQLPGTWDTSKDQAGSLDPRRRIISTCPKLPATIHLVIGKDRIWTQ